MTFAKVGENANSLLNIYDSLNKLYTSGKEYSDVINDLKKATDELSPSQAALSLAMANVNEHIARRVLEQRGLSKELITQTMETYKTAAADQALAKAEGVAAGSTDILTAALDRARMSLKNIGTAIKLHPVVAAFMAVAAAIGVATYAYQKHKKAQEEALNKAKEELSVYNSNLKSIEDYSDKYKKLHKALVDAKGDEEKTYSVKKDLLELQEELNSSFGEAYGKVSLLTDAYQDQTDVLKSLNKELASQVLNDIGEKEIKEITKQMTEPKRYNISDQFILTDSNRGKALKKIAEKYFEQGVKIEDTTMDDIETFTIVINANPRDAYKTISQFMTDVRDEAMALGNEHLFDGTLEISKKSYDKTKTILDDVGDTYNQILTAQIAKNDTLSGQYEEAIQAVNDYNDAVLKSADPYNDRNVERAYDHLNKIKSGIQENEKEWGKYSIIIDGVFDKADTSLIEFSKKIKNNEWNIGTLVNGIKAQELTDIDLEARVDSGTAGVEFDALAQKAKYYGIEIKDLILLLKQLKIVQSDVKNSVKDTVYSESKMISAVNGLADGFESLDKIYASIKGKDPFDYTLLDDKKFNDTFSGLGDSYTSFVKTLASSPKDIDACQSAFNELVTEWLNSSDVIDGLSDNTKQLTIDMLYNMGVSNAEEAVTDILADKNATLAAQKEYCAATGKELADSTEDEVIAFLAESDASDTAKQHLALLRLAKIECNDTGIVTDGDIDNLINLAAAAKVAENAVKNAKAAQNAKNESGVVRSAGAENAINNSIFDNLHDEIEEELKTPWDFNYSGGKASNKSSGSGKSKKDPTQFDWMERRLAIIDSQVDKLKDKIDILVGYKGKNATTDTAIDLLIEKMSILQKMHDKYMEEAGKIGLSQEYIDKIQNGSIEIETIGDEKLATQIKNFQDLFEKAENCTNQITETTKAVHDLNISKLENIKNQFDQTIDIQNQLIDTEKQLLDIREKSGETIYSDDYISLAGKQLNLVHANVDAYNALSAEMDKLNLQKGSEEWKTYNDQLQNYKNNMLSAADAVEQYKDAMTELVYKDLNDFKSAMDSVNGTISTMSNLIGSTNLVDEFGKLTERGLAQVALYAHQLANAKQEAAEYDEAIKSLDDALDSGLITQDEYNSRLHEYTSAQESAVQASKEARDAMIALAKEGIQAEIDAKRKLVDETIAALEAEQDLHDYQNSINEKQDNISKLQRQIAALGNSTNRDDIAQRLKLQSELAAAQKDLYETQYDHEIEQRKQALEDEYDAFEESKQKESDELDTNLDAQNAAIEKYLSEVKKNYSTVYGVLTQYGDEYSLTAIDDLTKPWESGSDAANLCADAISNAVANINYEIESINTSPLWDLVEALNSIGEYGYGGNASANSFDDITGTGKWQKGKGGKWWYGEEYRDDGNYNYASGGIYTINGKQYGFDDDGYMITGWNDNDGQWRYFEPDNGQMVKSTWREDRNGNSYYLDKNGVMAANCAVKAKDGNDYYYVNEDGMWDGQSLSHEEVKRRGLTVAYKMGTRNARKGFNLMDENGIGSEAIITDQGVLRQFEGGETVFDDSKVKKLWEFACDPTKFMSNLNGMKTVNYDLSKIHPAQNLVIDSPLIQIDGTGMSPQEVAAMINNEVQKVPKRVVEQIRYARLGK